MKYYYAEIHYKDPDGSNYYVGGRNGNIIEWDDDTCLYADEDTMEEAIYNMTENAKESGDWDDIDWVERGYVKK